MAGAHEAQDGLGVDGIVGDALVQGRIEREQALHDRLHQLDPDPVAVRIEAIRTVVSSRARGIAMVWRLGIESVRSSIRLFWAGAAAISTDFGH